MSNLTLDLSGIVNEAINQKMAEFDIEKQIADAVGVATAKASKVLEVKLNGEEKGTKIPLVHKQFEQLVTASSCGVNICLTGGAGLSKSTAVEQLATAFKLDFAQISFSNQTTKTDLIGFVDANGVYRKSTFVDAFENGKVFLADEMDACSSNVLVVLNSAISNGFIETPDNKIIRKHENFRIVATANTNLKGAKNGFTARNKLDGASIDRFAVIEWQLDEELEQKLTNNDGWLKIVRKCREVAERNLEGVVITPRSSYDGAKLIKAGLPIDQVIQMTIIKAMGEDEEQTLLRHITKNMKNEAMGVKVEPKKLEAEAVTVEPKKAEVEVEAEAVTDSSDDDFNW